jgi:hypothetical protein
VNSLGGHGGQWMVEARQHTREPRRQ